MATADLKIVLALILLVGLPILGHYLWVAPSLEEEKSYNAYFDCEEGILTSWVVQVPHDVRERLDLVDNHGFGLWNFSVLSDNEISSIKSSDFWEARTRAAKSIGVSEAELIKLDRKVCQECGDFPKWEDKFPYGRERRK